MSSFSKSNISNLSDYDYSSKILVIGDAGIGKSALITRYIDDNYNDNYYNTIGVDFRIKICDIHDKKIKINIWDTAGQEKFKSLITSYYRNSDIIIMVFDLSNQMSFRHIDYWYSEIEYFCKDMKVYLVGTKSDIGKNNYIVDDESINNICNKYNMTYYETSAKKNKNINELFDDIVENIYIKCLSKKATEETLLIEEKENNKSTCLNCSIL